MSDYAEKLKDPRWQKKRLEILNRDNFTCKHCDAKDKTLHVHHKTYVYGNDPWDYHENNFVSLCQDCHIDEEQYKQEAKGMLEDLMKMGFKSEEICNHLAKLISQNG